MEEKLRSGCLSVVIPAYREEASVLEAASVIASLLEGAEIPYELLFVDDGSKDATWARIQSAAQQNPHVRGIRFSRNFGKESAIYAGLFHASGDCCAVIDCDLQHPPEKLIEMYRLWQQGYEVVEAVKTDRGEEAALHRLFANLFYSIISRITGLDMHSASDFKLLDRKAVTVLLNMKERNSFFRALSSWIGFRTVQVPFEVQQRNAGESKWSPLSLVRYAISNITSFSAAPMQLVTICGVLMFAVSVVMGAIALTQKICGVALGGFTTVIILQLFSSSIIMFSLGIIGYYIAKIYDEIKARPKYIVMEQCGVQTGEEAYTDAFEEAV